MRQLIIVKIWGGRIPTIDELRTLIQNCPGTETGGECAVTNSCNFKECWSVACYACDYGSLGKYSVFGDTTYFWSSTTNISFTDYVWYVDFLNGRVNHRHKPSLSYVRCVR